MYDASAKAHTDAVSLNDCSNLGPVLQNNTWNILIRSRMHPVAVNRDLKKGFLQVRVRREDRDALGFTGNQEKIQSPGRIFIFSQEGWKNFRWGASHMQYAILDALGGA